MGKITFTVEGSTVGTVANGGGVVVEWEVSETDSARLVGAMLDKHRVRFLKKPNIHAPEPLPVTVENICKVWIEDVVKSAIKEAEDFERRKVSVSPILVAVP